MAREYRLESPPDNSVQPGVIEFFRTFYSISDTPDKHDHYFDMFTSDGTFILASKSAQGHEEIRKMRIAMWDDISSRKNQVFKIFPFGQGSEEVMLYGTVALEKKDATTAAINWAARAELVRCASDGKYRMKFYQVYLDNSGGAYKKAD